MKTGRENDEQTFGVDNDEERFAVDDDEQPRSAVEASAREDEGRDAQENDSSGPTPVERLWLVATAAFLIAAAVLLLRSNTDAAFVTAALGVCAWFLNVRDRLKREHGLRKRGRRNWEPRQ
jgi:Flp pilus assembly protein TadB